MLCFSSFYLHLTSVEVQTAIRRKSSFTAISMRVGGGGADGVTGGQRRLAYMRSFIKEIYEEQGEQQEVQEEDEQQEE